MQDSGVPTKFPIPFGNGAGPGYIRTIPEASQVGIQDGAASLTDGFPPSNFTPVGAGGVPPFGADFNGILHQLTQWAQWLSAGGPCVYDATFSSNIGGYPKGAIITSATVPGVLWISTADNNLSDPDAAGANWVNFTGVRPLTSTGGGVTYTNAMLGSQVNRSNSGNAMQDVLPGTSPGVLLDGGTFTVTNLDSSALLSIKAGAGSTLQYPGGFLYLGPNQSVTFRVSGTSYWPLNPPLRTRLGANTAIFVSTTGNDSTNDGLKTSSPFLTWQKAADFIRDQLDLGAFIITATDTGGGTYTAGLAMDGPPLGGGNAAQVVFALGTATLSLTAAIGFFAQGGAAFTVSGGIFTGTGGSTALAAELGGTIYYGVGTQTFGAMTGGAHILANGSGAFALAIGNYAISGGAANHISSLLGGFVDINARTLTLSGSPAFTQFVFAGAAGNIHAAGNTFSGTGATGKRYTIATGATVDTNGAQATPTTNYLPGDAAGTSTTGYIT